VHHGDDTRQQASGAATKFVQINAALALTKMNVVVSASGTVFFMLLEAAGGSRSVSCSIHTKTAI
jgi:hypothetical protein